MSHEPAGFRPKRFPPPEFPPRRARAFSNTPPAIFPVLLGLLGLQLALRAGLGRLGLPQAPADLLAGIVLPLWAFGVLAYKAKLARRPGAVLDDMKVMPSRAGLAAATVGGMLAAAVLAPFAPVVAEVLLWLSLAAHTALAALHLWLLPRLPAESRGLNPGWHLSFTGFIVGALAAAVLGRDGLAIALFWLSLPVALAIWGFSAVQLIRRIPPAPLRPLLAIHLAPASLFASVAALTGQGLLATIFGGVALAIALALAASARWLTTSGFSPLWGAFTFPLTATAAALIRLDGFWASLGIGLLAVALVAVPWIGWRVLKLWPGGRLAAKTNAAEA